MTAASSCGMRGPFGACLPRLEAAGDRGLAVIGRRDDQQIVRAHPPFRAQDLLQPRMRLVRPAVADPQIPIDVRDAPGSIGVKQPARGIAEVFGGPGVAHLRAPRRQ
jgi:hypothetical protein